MDDWTRLEHEHNERSRKLADAIAHWSRLATVAAGTDMGDQAKRTARVMTRRALAENAHYFDAVTSRDSERYWGWKPRWLRQPSAR